MNVKLSLKQPSDDVLELMPMLGFKKEFTITKDCDIYFISGAVAHVSIVWYIVHKDGAKDQVFIEVEVEGLSHNKSLKVLNTWVEQIQSMFNLKKKDFSNDSLYEIYSGKRYQNA